MALFTNCQECRGSGSVKCPDCICPSCHESGKVSCPKCEDGRVKCTTCSATGRVPCDTCDGEGQIIKKNWIFKRKISCTTCSGEGQDKCPTCEGSTTVSCPKCGGSTRIACLKCSGKGVLDVCARCSDSRQIICVDCDGEGKFETEWSQKLRNTPEDRLRFEFETRQREAQALQQKIWHEERELERMDEEYEASGRQSPPPLDSVHGTQPQLIMEIGHELRRVEEEMEDIQTVMNEK